MSTILATIRWLSIFTGALSLFYLGHAWFEVGLGGVFTRIYAWYAGILHPVAELLKPVALWLVGLFGGALPVRWKDALVLYFAMGGATIRGLGEIARNVERNVDSGATPGRFQTRYAAWRVAVLAAAPLAIVLWPAFLLTSPLIDRLNSYRRGDSIYMPELQTFAAIEFFKILIGGLMFAGLNAGLG